MKMGVIKKIIPEASIYKQQATKATALFSFSSLKVAKRIEFAHQKTKPKEMTALESSECIKNKASLEQSEKHF